MLKRWQMGQITVRLTAACMLITCCSDAIGEIKVDRTCKTEERLQANERLRNIDKDKNWSHQLVEEHLPFGPHVSRHTAEGGPTNEVMLVQGGYIAFHDGDLRTALWTAHKLTGEDVRLGACNVRVECFLKDIRLPSEDHAAVTQDYDEPEDAQGPKFAKAHMVSDRDLRDDVTEQVNTYVMSNMSPQYGGFNGGVWLRLEQLGRAWANEFGTVYVTSGAVFDQNDDKIRDRDEDVARVPKTNGPGRVGIPSHYFKVFLRKSEDGWLSISFLLKHRDGNSGGKAKQRLANAIMPLKEIENRVEIELHPKLDRKLLRQSIDWTEWRYLPRLPKNENACEN